MYEFIEGHLAEKNPAYVVVNSNGVGYIIHISLHTYSFVQNIVSDGKIRLLIHFVVREDAQLFYGFHDAQERSIFRMLISVSGVGANTARMMLSSLKPEEIVQAIATDNVGELKAVKGIGAKTAQRIIVDLKDKMGRETLGSDNLPIAHNTKKDESLSALIMLGFTRSHAEKAVNKVLGSADEIITVEEIIKQSLRIL